MICLSPSTTQSPSTTARPAAPRQSQLQLWRQSLKQHWPEYLSEGALLGLFMMSALFCTALFEHPSSWVQNAIPDVFTRRALLGAAMGLTAVALIYSPWGQRSGAHLNPAVTLAFLRLGKVPPRDALFYISAQFAGGFAGIVVSVSILGPPAADPSVRYVVTVPGSSGPGTALAAETLLSAGMMALVLWATNRARLARFTGWFAGILLSLYITLEAPVSGMSINPARTVASALPSHVWTSAWLYFVGPIGGMWVVAEWYRRRQRPPQLACPKLHHGTRQRCIFCGKRKATATNEIPKAPSPLPDRNGRITPFTL